jgi:hypothetical protein
MAGRGQVSWLPGIGRPHLPRGSVSSPVAGARCARGLLHPVTVAGPRRSLTGLPLTTDRIYATESIRCDPGTTRRRNFLILRTTRASERPSVAPVLPEVENPIPETIGLGAIFSMGTAGGMVLFVVATTLRFPDARRKQWGKAGLLIGFGLGLAFYLIALVTQLLCRQ